MITNKKISMSKTDPFEVLLEVGTEGGGLSIHRFRAPDGAWKFIFITDESTMADFLDEEDQIELVKKYPPVETFDEAIELMNKYPWHKMHLITMHQEYAEVIQSEKEKRSTLKMSKSMNAHGILTSGVAKYITDEMNKRGCDVYYDHDKPGQFVGTIPVSIKKELTSKDQISQLDMPVV